MAAARFRIMYTCLSCGEKHITVRHECAQGLCTPERHFDFCRLCGGDKGDGKTKNPGLIAESFERQFEKPAPKLLTGRVVEPRLRLRLADET